MISLLTKENDGFLIPLLSERITILLKSNSSLKYDVLHI